MAVSNLPITSPSLLSEKPQYSVGDNDRHRHARFATVLRHRPPNGSDRDRANRSRWVILTVTKRKIGP
jgi:hypothetical protein